MGKLTYGQLADLTVAEGDVVTTRKLSERWRSHHQILQRGGCNVYFKADQDGQPVNPLNR